MPAEVAPSTASAHLTLLAEGGLLTHVRQGRHRYVRLADPAVAQLLDDLAAHADRTAPVMPPRTLRAAARATAMARARTCYDHLAGGLGVAITDALLRTGLLQDATGFALTDAGLAWFADTLGGLTCSASTWPAPADHRVRSNPLARGRRVVGSPACGNGPRCFRVFLADGLRNGVSL